MVGSAANHNLHFVKGVVTGIETLETSRERPMRFCLSLLVVLFTR